MDILVTGATGFVGKRLCKELEKKGHQVQRFVGDIRNLDDCKKNVAGKQVVYHLAAVIDENDKRGLFEVNVHGTQNILEAAIAEKAEQFIFASSVGTLGDFSGVGTEETPYNPVTPYEQSKRDAEKIVWDAQEMIPITILLPALILGPNKIWHQILSFVKKNCCLIGDGKNSFQIVYIDDVVSAFVFVLENPDCLGERFIVAEKKGKTLEELYKILKKEMGSNKPIKKVSPFIARLYIGYHQLSCRLSGKKPRLHTDYILRMLKNRKYSIAKLEGLGWHPRYSTEQAAHKTITELEL